MTIAEYQQLQNELCEALGLDPHDVQALDLHLEANSFPTLTAKVFVRDANTVGKVLRRFQWSEVEEPTTDKVRLSESG